MTLSQKEARLNQELASEPAAVINARFLYLTNKQRRNYCSPTLLSKRVRSGKVGSLIKVLDRGYFDTLTEGYFHN